MANSSAHLQIKSAQSAAQTTNDTHEEISETVQPERKCQTQSTTTTTVQIILVLLSAGVLVALAVAVAAVVINQQQVSELTEKNKKLEVTLHELQTMLAKPTETELPQPSISTSLVTMLPETTVSTPSYMRSCAAIHASNSSAPIGVYTIYIEGRVPGRKVWCDMVTDGGGWTRFQYRWDGSVNFSRTWSNYRSGFGSADAEFWLGNDDLHRLTAAQPSELRVDLLDRAGRHGYAKYSTFSVGSASNNYRLHVDGYRGTIGDSLTFHNSWQFSTRDRDNDGDSRNCAATFGGGWWYNDCYHANLNGRYVPDGKITWSGVTWGGVNWDEWQGPSYSYKAAVMLTRPRN